jgi:hypothetical protein
VQYLEGGLPIASGISPVRGLAKIEVGDSDELTVSVNTPEITFLQGTQARHTQTTYNRWDCP